MTCESLGADIPLGRSGARCSVTDARHDRAGFPANSCVPVVAGTYFTDRSSTLVDALQHQLTRVE